ncbi:hypothetical protein Pfo_003561 [Paulownia fortunei]|nr:hypothetical protein Pfo_003561 [Paulownia fortunei]
MCKIPTPFRTHFSYYICIAFCIGQCEFGCFLLDSCCWRIEMELHLELALSSSLGKGFDPNQDCDKKKKRSFDEAFLDIKKNVDVPQTLPLLKWDEYEEQQQIVGELYDQKHIQKLTISNRNAEVEDDFVVGWPPVKSWRKQFCHQNRPLCTNNYVNVENSGGGGGGGGRGSNSTYLKVKMEGVGITRKIDLSIHHSYQTLTAKLIALFGICKHILWLTITISPLGPKFSSLFPF